MAGHNGRARASGATLALAACLISSPGLAQSASVQPAPDQLAPAQPTTAPSTPGQPGPAQAAPDQPAPGAEGPAYADSSELVVTARRREERVQDVPISITAYSGDTLVKIGMRDFTGLGLSNPNVKIESFQGIGGSLGSSVAIRGNIQSATHLLADPAVGTYMDEHIISRTFGLYSLAVDTASVQTLKGPQGTLFGRNSTGGALSVQTVNPTLRETSGYVFIQAGELDSYGVGAALNIPIGDAAAGRIVYQRERYGDYASYSNGVELGRRKNEVVRGKLRVQPTDTMDIVVMGEYTRMTNHSVIVPVSQPNRPIYKNIPITIIGQGAAPVDPRTNEEASKFTGTFFTLNATQEIGPGTLKLLLARRDYTIRVAQSLPPGLGFTFQDKPGSDDFSAELQFNGKLFGDLLDVASGLFYFEDTLKEFLDTRFYTGISQATNKITGKGESYSAYVQTTAHLGERINVTGGLRYTHDDKRAVGNVANFSPTTSGDPETALTNPVATYADKNERVNYLVSADFKPVDGIMVYASHATGYRAGAANVGRQSLVTTAPGYTLLQFFLPENIKNYEAGAKTELFDRRFRLNGTYFHQDYKGYQYGSTDPVLLLRRTFNSDAVIKGFELDGSLRLGEGTVLSATYGQARGKVTDPASTANGARLPLIPRTTWSITASQNIAIGEGELDLTANYNWRSKISTLIQDSATAIDEPAVTTIRSLGLLNASAIYTLDNLEFSVTATNLLDKKYNTFATVVGSALNFGGLGVSRVITGRVKYRF